jgi:N-acetylmuramic acid 6-phosphate etherase
VNSAGDLKGEMKKADELSILATESINLLTRDLDKLPTSELVRVINDEDARVPGAVQQALPEIASAIDAVAARMCRGGRLIYIGAGTSGRLGVLDASECPPTFGVSPILVIGLIAGGDLALRQSVEAAEDRAEQGQADLQKLNLGPEDSVVGLTASGRTPYVLGGLDYARSIGALAVGVACNRPAAISNHSDIAILAEVGPEILSGSTRLKSGTAQKMILNMLSTAVMVRLGKTYGNLMVDLRPTNIKLRERALRLFCQITGCGEEDAKVVLENCNWEVKTAIVVYRLNCLPDEGRLKLESAGGFVRKVLEEN